MFEVRREAGDLLALVFGRDGDENRFVETPAEEFDLAFRNESLQARKILTAIRFDPLEQRTGIVQADVDGGMFFEEFDEREIGVLEGFFEDVGEIAARLVGMDHEDEMKAFRHGTILLSSIIPCGREIPVCEMRYSARKAHCGCGRCADLGRRCADLGRRLTPFAACERLAIESLNRG